MTDHELFLTQAAQQARIVRQSKRPMWRTLAWAYWLSGGLLIAAWAIVEVWR